MKNKWGLDPDLLDCLQDTIRERYGNISPKQMESVINQIMEYNERERFIMAGLSESDWQEDPD